MEQDGKVVWNALDEYRKALEEQKARKANNIVVFSQKVEANTNVAASA